MNQYGSNQLSFRTTSLFAKLLIDLFLFRRNASLYEFISCHFSTFSGVASGKVSKKLRIGIRHLLLWLPNFLERVKPTRKKRAAFTLSLFSVTGEKQDSSIMITGTTGPVIMIYVHLAISGTVIGRNAV